MTVSRRQKRNNLLGENSHGKRTARHVSASTRRNPTGVSASQQHGRSDSPLKPGTELRDAIKVLNRELKRITFYADGTGQGITWSQEERDSRSLKGRLAFENGR